MAVCQGGGHFSRRAGCYTGCSSGSPPGRQSLDKVQGLPKTEVSLKWSVKNTRTRRATSGATLRWDRYEVRWEIVLPEDHIRTRATTVTTSSRPK